MLVVLPLAIFFMGQRSPLLISPRFQPAAPLSSLPSIMIDGTQNGIGLAQQAARAEGLQARIIWIDASANLDRFNTEEKIVALVRKIADTGFNTIVLDIKPISGQVIYSSRIAPKLTEWRGQTLPANFDPVPIFVRESHKSTLDLFVSLNAFSEGHRIPRVGPGYAKLEQQTVLYEGKPVVKSSSGSTFGLDVTPETRDAEKIGIARQIPLVLDRVGFAVTVRANNEVVDGFDLSELHSQMTLPRGGYLLWGAGMAGDFLRRECTPGSTVSLDTTPVFVPISERPEGQIPLMMNPNHPEIRRYELDIVREVAQKYEVDGILYDDRFRYGGIDADFSSVTRSKFETFVGKDLAWPDDIFKFTLTPALGRGILPGKYYETWMEWRAAQLRSFLWEVRRVVKGARPSVKIGLYAGSWYGEYPALGNNYGSNQLDAGFWFLTPGYRKTGLAPLLDFMISGCYYPTATIYEAMGKGLPIGNCIESAGTLTNRVVRDETWAYAGIALSDYQGNQPGLRAALQAACATTQGVMVFDLSHNIEASWPVFADAFRQRRKSPHDKMGLLDQVRKRRIAVDKMKIPDPPVIIAAGSAGTGQ